LRTKRGVSLVAIGSTMSKGERMRRSTPAFAGAAPRSVTI
jgi:hypothetical protein